MNKRILKKKNNQVIKQIRKIKLNSEDNLILRFDMDNIYPEEVRDILNWVHNIFPNNKVIALPTQIKSVNKYDYDSFITFLEQIISYMKNETSKNEQYSHS